MYIYFKKDCILLQLTVSLVKMNKLLQFLVFLLPIVVESALVRNDLHVLRKKILGHKIYDRHVKPDGKVDVSFGIDVMDMDFCPHKHVNNIIFLFLYLAVSTKMDR